MNRILLPLAVLAAFAASCGKKNDAPGGSGFVEATKIVVSAQTAGELRARLVNEGDRIGHGQQIAVVDTSTVVLQIAKAHALRREVTARREIARINVRQTADSFELAKKEFERIASLIKTGSANQQQYDRSENAYRQAELAKKQADAAHEGALAEIARIETEIALLEKQLRDCYPISPTSGVVVNKFVEAGELLRVGAPLVEIARLDTVWVKVYLPPRDLTRIKLGGLATVDPEDGRTKFTGRVSWISEEAEFTPKNVQTKQARADLVYAVKVHIPNREGLLKIGMPVMVTFP